MRSAIRVAIAGATGYGGVEAVRLLSRHPHVELAYLGSQTYAGQEIARVYPHLELRPRSNVGAQLPSRQRMGAPRRAGGGARRGFEACESYSALT